MTLNGQDVTGDFHGSVGLVTGLMVGDNRLQLLNTGRPVETLDITDYPITGPIFSGAQQKPFICTTDSFVLPVTGRDAWTTARCQLLSSHESRLCLYVD